MTTLKIFAVFFVLFIVLLNGASQDVNQKQKPVAQDVQAPKSVQELQPFSTLSLELAGPEESLIPVQPIPVVLKLTNRNSLPALGYRTIGFGECPVFIYVKKEGANSRVVISALTPILAFNVYKNLPVEPGETISANEWITLHLRKYFPEPGRYELHAVMSNADGTQLIESNTTIVVIREPTGIDRQAMNLIKNRGFQDYLYSGLEFDKVKGTLEQLKTLYPTSPYARGASFLLGETYFYGRNYPQALTNLLRLENDNRFIHADKVRKYLTEIRRINPNLQPESEKP